MVERRCQDGGHPSAGVSTWLEPILGRRCLASSHLAQPELGFQRAGAVAVVADHPLVGGSGAGRVSSRPKCAPRLEQSLGAEVIVRPRGRGLLIGLSGFSQAPPLLQGRSEEVVGRSLKPGPRTGLREARELANRRVRFATDQSQLA